uniref:C-type lectin domain-containing protein n=1 Tax=Sinocyclocheilus rhinocerous TaxID=307959 RepID=A0A673HBC6_9TELE
HLSVSLIFLVITTVAHILYSREDLCEQSWMGVCLCCFSCQVGNWTDAQSYCRQHHTDLATIHNSEEWNLIKSVIPSKSWVWFGLFLDSWEWSDKWNRFFRHWASGQPSMSSGSDDCVGMSTTSSGKWAQYSCDLQQPFICHGGEFPQFTETND